MNKIQPDSSIYHTSVKKYCISPEISPYSDTFPHTSENTSATSDALLQVQSVTGTRVPLAQLAHLHRFTHVSLFIPLHLVLSDLLYCAWPETSSLHITSSLCGYNGGCENISQQQCVYREKSVQRFFYFVGRRLCLDPWLQFCSTW